MPSVLFVCLGNICRSPCAQGVFEHLIREAETAIPFHVESCGLGDWHTGQLPDERMRRTAEIRGVILSSRAQPFQEVFFESFDYILAVDLKVLYQLHSWANTPEHKAKVHLMTKFGNLYKDEEIPDPYYFGQGHFDLVMTMIEDACEGLLNHILETRDPSKK